MGNKSFEMYCAYIDPEELRTKTPSQRLYSVAGPFKATSVTRTLSQFWNEMATEFGWGKKDVMLIGVQPGGLTPDMKKGFVEDDEDVVDTEEVVADEALTEQLQEDAESEEDDDDEESVEEIEEDEDDEDEDEIEDDEEDDEEED